LRVRFGQFVPGDAPVLVPLAQLHPHPDNPRLMIRQEVVDGIAAAVKDGFPAKYALIVRPLGKGFQILAGHHRKLAAEKAGLTAAPCWIEEMGEEDAFLELVRSNRQSELSPLEEGKHAADSGMDLKAYAAEVGKPRQTLQHKLYAYRVRQTVPDFGHDVVAPRWNQLGEIHVAPEWLRRALALRMLEAGWNVETTRSNAGRLKDVPEPPEWADADAIAGP
jgi:ParB-like chromosome segregation protein Spo0J